jgi:hypothetical protein
VSADIREVWPGEALDFTPWLADNLDWIDVVGLGPLSLIGQEVSLPDTGRSLDLLAETSDGHKVAIENQYGRADHDHLTRGLAYAIGLGASALVVIAEDHRSEFVAIADYLNTAYEQMDEEDGVAIFLVTVTVERVADLFVPRFTVAAAPNAWRTRARATRRETVESIDAFLESSEPESRPGYSEMIRFWEGKPGASLKRNGKTVGLVFRLDGPVKRLRSLFTLEPNGIVWINRDFCREITGLEDDELDRLLEANAPGFSVVGIGDWWKAHRPSVASLRLFAEAITSPP